MTLQNTEIYKLRNNQANPDLMDRAQSIKWAIASRIRQYTANVDIVCCCLAYLTSKCFFKYNNPMDLDLRKVIDDIEDKDIANYIYDHVTPDILNAAKDICLGASLDLLEMIPFLPDEYSGRYGEYSTPKTIGDLARELLGIKDNSKVADICCGKGNFILDAYLDNQTNRYYGNDINTDCIYLAKIRFDLLEDNAKKSIVIKQENVFDDNTDNSFDRVFSNYPFGFRTRDNNQMLDFILQHGEFNLSESVSSEWVFNSLVKTKLNEKGKAVVIMPNGPLFKLGSDLNIRKQFVENGYINSVIALPKNMYDYTAIPTTMLILGNNKSNSIRFVDASNCYEKTRRLNVLSKANISEIVNALTNDSDISRDVSYDELADNDYNLTPQRYLNNVIDFKNGVEFGTVIKSITRGAGISASELDKISSVDKTNYQYVMLANIKGGIIDSKLPYITEIPEKYERYCIKNNSLLLSKNGAPYKVAVAKVEENTKILANGNLFVIEIDEDKADPNYLKAFFNSQEGNKVLSSLSTNGTIPSISVNDLKKVSIPIPSLQKQKEIAKDFLIVEDEIKVLEKKINKCREKLVGIFNTEEDA